MLNLENISHITIGDIINFAPAMKLSIRDATPIVDNFMADHKLTDAEMKDVSRVVIALGLYKP